MGTIAEDGLTHPFDKTTGLTKGFAFVNFLNPQDAKQAAATLNGWQLDKSHNIKVRVESYRTRCLAAVYAINSQRRPRKMKKYKPAGAPKREVTIDKIMSHR